MGWSDRLSDVYIEDTAVEVTGSAAAASAFGVDG